MTSRIRLGAIFWLLTVEFFITQFAAQAAWPVYSAIDLDISLLGLNACDGPDPNAVALNCSPLNLVFNGGMILNGILVALGVWFTRTLWPRSVVTATALSLLAIGGGGGSILVGLFPFNVNMPMHTAGAVLALFVACFGIALMAVALWRTHRAFAIYGTATAAIGLAAFLLYALELYLGIGRGTMERIAAWPHTIWYMVTGALILRGYFKPSAW